MGKGIRLEVGRLQVVAGILAEDNLQAVGILHAEGMDSPVVVEAARRPQVDGGLR